MNLFLANAINQSLESNTVGIWIVLSNPFSLFSMGYEKCKVHESKPADLENFKHIHSNKPKIDVMSAQLFKT